MIKRQHSLTQDAQVDDDDAALLPIRTVAALTGIKTGTLRIWELRYHLLTPVRTDTGHRLYTQRDVAKLNEVQRLLDGGISIGQVSAHLAEHKSSAAGLPAAPHDNIDAQRIVMLDAVGRFDERELSNAYSNLLALYPLDIVTKRILMPMLSQLGMRWAETAAGIAEEHFFSHFLRNKLGAQLHHREANPDGARLLLACLPRERHEIGLLLFANYLLDVGCRATVLGADLPLTETARVAQRGGFAGVVLSGSCDHSIDSEHDALRALVQSVAAPVFVGGAVAVRHAQAIQKCGAIAAGTDLRQGWAIIRERLSTSAD